MLEDFRCGRCARLLARTGGLCELQIKCPRCGTFNHARAASPERSPQSDMTAATAAPFRYQENAMHSHERDAPAPAGAP